MKTLYCDASFSPTSTNKTTEPFVRGKIAIADKDGFQRVEKVVVGKVEGLQQYNNVLELTAIARAIEIACNERDKVNSLCIYTDSKVAMYWARAGGIKRIGVETPAHTGALEYLRKTRLLFGGIVTFHFVPRDYNPAGKLLEAELEREPSYSI